MAVELEIDFHDGRGPVRVRLEQGQQVEIYPDGYEEDDEDSELLDGLADQFSASD
jgi:hypothetical protein